MTFSDKTLADLQWSKVLDALGARAKTDLGKARSLARRFLTRAEEVEEALARIEELRRLAVEERLELPLWGVRDVSSLLERAGKRGTLEAPELLACATVLHSLARAKDFVEARRANMPRAFATSERIADLTRVAGRLERAFEPGGELSDRASPLLFELRERTRSLHRHIKGKLDGLLHSDEFTRLLRENYFTIRNERYVVPVLASARSQVPGIVHNASQSGQTLFVEPEPLIALGNELTIAQSMVLEEERRILGELSGALGEHAVEIEGSLEAASELDAVEAAAKLALDLCAEPPTPVPAQAPFRLLAMRHPLLALQKDKAVVPNDVSFNAEASILVVSGPNAGGKTVTLTGIGLCAVMLRAGLPVPAERGSSLPLFEAIDSAVGDAQDMAKDLSTFSAHLTALRDIAAKAREGSLVLIDEIAADTDPREGAAIALAVLDDLAQKGARVVVTTHLEELKAVAVTDPRYVNARVGFDTARMAPTYKLQYGTPGASSAIEIARRVGLDPKVCAKAEENLKTTSGPLGRALTALDAERGALESARLGLETERAALSAREADLARERATVRERERAIEAEARRELVAQVERSRAEVAQLLARLQGKPTIRAAVDAQAELSRVAQVEAHRLEAQEAQAAAKSERLPEGSAVQVGMRVKLPNSMEGQVLEVSGEEAVVQAGALKLRQKLGDLVLLKGAPKAARFPGKSGRREEKLREAEEAGAGALHHGDIKIDVRGMRAEDAVKAVETFLDRCYGEGRTAAFIVHGLGTGALRASLRDYLKGSAYVRGFRAGEEHEGGEGTTVVALRG
jgi:DNA mismatch repair protein MutS2